MDSTIQDIAQLKFDAEESRLEKVRSDRDRLATELCHLQKMLSQVDQTTIPLPGAAMERWFRFLSMRINELSTKLDELDLLIATQKSSVASALASVVMLGGSSDD